MANARHGVSLAEQMEYSAEKVKLIYHYNLQIDARENGERLSLHNAAFQGGKAAEELAEHYVRGAGGLIEPESEGDEEF